MRFIVIRTLVFFKGLLLFFRPGLFLGWLRGPFLMISNTISLSKWISAQEKDGVMNDFYTVKRDHSRRYKLYEFVIGKTGIRNEAVDYLEFGVFEGNSFKWWLANNTNADSRFYGFDTFEGLPEAWGTYDAGNMLANIPQVNDQRATFVKGLFQETVPGFLREQDLNNGKRKILHLDADLFSSTLYALTNLAPYLKKGDILLFDEFNVPNHEYFAFKIFCDSYYVKTRLLGAVNNFYQVALIIE